jgi:glycosyltransferase involved in cell wall biosynthesis
MKVLVDLQSCQGQSREHGIGRWSLHFTRALARRPEVELHVLVSDRFPGSVSALQRELADLVPEDRFHLACLPEGIARLAGPSERLLATADELWRSAIRSVAPDAVVLTSVFEGLVEDIWVSARHEATDPLVAAVVYDFIPLRLPERYFGRGGPVPRQWYEERLAQLREADLHLCISEYAAQESRSLVPLDPPAASVAVGTGVEWGFGGVLEPRVVEEALGGFGLEERGYVLCVGEILEPRKNVEGLLRAWGRVDEGSRRGTKVVVVSSAGEEARRRAERWCADAGVSVDDVVLTGRVPDQALQALYQAAAVVVVPSLLEGFGLPAAEAMLFDVPVVCAARGALTEVAPVPEALFDPEDPEELAHLLRRCLGDPAFGERLVAGGRAKLASLGWAAVGDRAYRALRAALDRRSTSTARPGRGATPSRPRVALVTPWPPARTGIADYAWQLWRALDRRGVAVEVVVPEPREAQGAAGVSLRSPGWLVAHRSEVDFVCYQIGNSEFHLWQLPLLDEVPGVVVLHDLGLAAMWRVAEGQGGPPGLLREVVFRSHGHVALQDLGRVPWDTFVSRWPASLPLVERSLGVVVHSQATLARVPESWRDGWHAPWFVLPPLWEVPARPEDRCAARRALGVGEGDLLVCSFGMVAPTKEPGKLLEGALQLPEGLRRRVRVVFVGDDAYLASVELREVLGRARAAGLRVESTGRVERDEYQRFLQGADLAVQLRRDSRGETSGALLDVLAAGVPAIVQRTGSFSELPDDVVWALGPRSGPGELREALQLLLDDEEARAKLGQAGRELVQRTHAPDAVATTLLGVLEEAYREAWRTRAGLTMRTSERVAAARFGSGEPERATRALAKRETLGGGRVLLDVGPILSLAGHERSRWGARSAERLRILESLARGLVLNELGRQVVPVHQHAGRFFVPRGAEQRLGLPDSGGGRDLELFPSRGDVVLCTGTGLLHPAARGGAAETLLDSGATVFAVLHGLRWTDRHEDVQRGGGLLLTPLQWLDRRVDGVLCTSRALAGRVGALAPLLRSRTGARLRVGFLEMGGDAETWVPPVVLADDSFGKWHDHDGHPLVLVVQDLDRAAISSVLAIGTRLWERGWEGRILLLGDLVGDDAWEAELDLTGHRAYGESLHWIPDARPGLLFRLLVRAGCVLTDGPDDEPPLVSLEAARLRVPVLATGTAGARADRHWPFDAVLDLADPDGAAGVVQGMVAAQGTRPGRRIRSWRETSTSVIELVLGQTRDGWLL